MSHGPAARMSSAWPTRCSSTSMPMRAERRWQTSSIRIWNTEQGADRMNQIVEKPKKYSLVERAPAASFEEERLHRKQRLAATFRLFSRCGFDQGLAGHVTVRDPEFPDRFWINPLSKFFGQIKVSDLQLVDHEGNILIGDKPINQPGFMIHSQLHAARPDVIAAAHTHSTYG